MNELQSSSGFQIDTLQNSVLHNRNQNKQPDNNDNELNEIIAKTKHLSINHNSPKESRLFVDYINPIALTLLSAAVRLYGINASPKVIWDEAHFGKFGSSYLKHEFYFDVHPPLGKLLVGLSGYIAGYSGNFRFDSGDKYPDDCNFLVMRVFNCIFGILCTPLAYKTAVLAGYSQFSVWLISLLVVFEMLSLTLSKFILLDSILLFFTVSSYYCLVRLHMLRLQNKLLTFEGIISLFATGVSLGCVCSVKWVGLFVTLLVGLYTIYDLLIRTYELMAENGNSYKTYAIHWISRILTLIVVPITIYMICFKIHFAVLTKSGPGDGSISTLLQASLEGNTIKEGARSVAFGSLVSIRSQGLSPNLLHSHHHMYPEGSQQQQVTTYGYKDSNNHFIIEFDVKSAQEGKFASLESDSLEELTQRLKNGDTIRLLHNQTHCLLHSHSFRAPILSSHYEVSCNGNLNINDHNDEWVLEIEEQVKSSSKYFANEDEDELHPISTNFRLRHKVLGCYLATTGISYPPWGFQQGEVVCKHSYFARDKTTWWNIEDHMNDLLPKPHEQYVPPSPKFWKEFVSLNYGMMASNNALVPDPDKFDRLSSEWWQWPIMQVGLRMGSWSIDDVKYFLVGHPVITWFSTASLFILIGRFVFLSFTWQRQNKDFSQIWDQVLVQGLTPLIGWILHFYPFIVMGRVTYIHHYVPALYFSIFVFAYVLESSLSIAPKLVRKFVFCIFYILILSVFWYYKPLALGMQGSCSNYQYLKLLKTWTICN
jgi:dolichyl-phosphate-mannose-protein mannosyltransferase